MNMHSNREHTADALTTSVIKEKLLLPSRDKLQAHVKKKRQVETHDLY